MPSMPPRQDRDAGDDVADRLVVVVGAGGALGAALCVAFIDAGARVHGLDLAVPDTGHPAVTYSGVDVGSDAALAAWFDDHPVPWAVLNAVGGFAPAVPITELSEPELTRQLSLNLVTAALITKHALRRMATTGEGRVVHTASRSALRTDGSSFAYSVSKLGVLHLVAMAAEETHGTGITVNAVVPGVLDTPANRAAMPAQDYTVWPQLPDIAAVYRFLASPQAKLVSGAAVPVYGLS